MFPCVTHLLWKIVVRNVHASSAFIMSELINSTESEISLSQSLKPENGSAAFGAALMLIIKGNEHAEAEKVNSLYNQLSFSLLVC